ncbi:hypothetical protein SDC9_131218 [bioreactor metagenome]|uniref:Uncharacterized protein n=1 Tax=bioreactor metagenome TaxID=1076179 RepID=A0A645D4N2_9ZZZZ
MAADIRHRLHLFRPADVAGVDADGVDPALRARQREFVVKVNVGNERDGNLLLNFIYGRSSRPVGNGHSNQFAPGGLQRFDLRHGGGHIVGFGAAHGLDRDRRAAAHGDGAHHQLLCHRYSLPQPNSRETS